MNRVLRSFLAIVVALSGAAFFGTVALFAGIPRASDRAHAWCTRNLSRLVLRVFGVRLNVGGMSPEETRLPRYYAGNHQSALDILVLMSALRGNLRFMAKRSLFRIPVFGWAMSRHGHIPIDRTDARTAAQVLQGLVDRLREHPVSLAVFPEGTRSSDGRLLPFRPGAMKIAQRAGLAVVPFAVDGTLLIHQRKSLRIQPGPVRLTFGRPIPAEEVAAMSSRELAERVFAEVARMMGQEEISQPPGVTPVGEEART